MLFSFGLMVFSSMVAAWADVKAATSPDTHPSEASDALKTLNAGYAWMFANVFCSAAYVLGRGRTIRKLKTKDWDSKHSPRQTPKHNISLADSSDQPPSTTTS